MRLSRAGHAVHGEQQGWHGVTGDIRIIVCLATPFLFQGILPIDQLRDHVPCINLMIQHVPVHVLEAKYGLVLQQDSQLTCEQLLGAYGVLRQVITVNHCLRVDLQLVHNAIQGFHDLWWKT